MLFNSYTFFAFFAGVLCLHHLPLPWRVRKLNLLWASYVFYAAWNPPFVVLLWISTVADWWIGRWIHQSDTPLARRTLLAASLAVNLGLLGFFKYGGFLLENFIALAAAVGIAFDPVEPDIILPVGISFYTFQTLSYTLDIYRGRMAPWNSLLDYSLYVTFFPQLVAGPIVRAGQFLPECLTPRRASGAQLTWGLSLLVLGLFQKTVVADGLLAPVVERLYDRPVQPDSLTAWCGTAAFAGQIFCDFAGYSNCAIGVALCLGFALPDNFQFPYAAVGFSDFWRRWHISLSTWFRDYVYIPLGGNRGGPLRTSSNLLLTMLIAGLWHGANWTFIVWGGLHGLFLAAEHLCRRFYPARRPLPPGVQLVCGMATFAAVCLAWTFFRANSLEQAFALAGAMLGAVPATAQATVTTSDLILVGSVTIVLLSAHWALRNTTLEHVAARLPWWVRSMALAGMIWSMATAHGEDRAFIYFQF